MQLIAFRFHAPPSTPMPNQTSAQRPASRPHRRAFTIIEVIVIVVILGVLAAVIAPRLIGRVGQAKQATAGTNAAAIASAVELYTADCGPPPAGAKLEDFLMRCPSGIEEEKWKQNGPYLKNVEQLKDPWGRPFVLVLPGRKNADYDIVSYGADGQPGGDGDNADITKP